MTRTTLLVVTRDARLALTHTHPWAKVQQVQALAAQSSNRWLSRMDDCEQGQRLMVRFAAVAEGAGGLPRSGAVQIFS